MPRSSGSGRRRSSPRCGRSPRRSRGSCSPASPATSVSPARAAEILGLADQGTHELDVAGGVRAVVEYGHVRFARGPDAASPEPVALPVPGGVRFGDWEVEAHLGEGGEAVLSADQLGPQVTVRAWRDGDRMRPAGLGGTKSLQDLFTDRKVPRALRRPAAGGRGRRRDRLGRRRGGR